MSDLINRADAVKAIRKCKFESDMPSDWYRGMEDAQDIVEDIPSAEATGALDDAIAKYVADGYMLPPSGDLISRADAIEAVAQQWLFEASVGNPYVNDDDIGEYRKLAEELFEDVPSADAGWIPCSERLPKRDELVLVTYKTTDRIHLCKYIDDGSENPWWSYIDDCCAWNNVVIAWMPLPKPYREDGEA